jgi:hypothetical protein
LTGIFRSPFFAPQMKTFSVRLRNLIFRETGTARASQLKLSSSTGQMEMFETRLRPQNAACLSLCAVTARLKHSRTLDSDSRMSLQKRSRKEGGAITSSPLLTHSSCLMDLNIILPCANNEHYDYMRDWEGHGVSRGIKSF